MEKEQILNTWELITEQSESRSNPYESTTRYTFKLRHIPSDKVVQTFEGSIYSNSIGEERDYGMTGVRFSEDKKHLICSADYGIVATYLLDDFLPK